MERPHFAYSSVCQGTLGGFHLLAIVDRAAVNMGIWSSSYFSFPPFLKDEVLYLLLCFVLVFFTRSLTWLFHYISLFIKIITVALGLWRQSYEGPSGPPRPCPP